jgi:trehalose 6-phosphate phosphatase
MQHLLTPRGEAAIDEVLARRPLLAFDFDGTLAPIVARPEAATISSPIARQLQALSGLRPVAVITGRSVADLLPRLPFRPCYVAGNHGAENGDAARERALEQALDPFRSRLQAWAARLHEAGVQVEDKRLSIALHHRRARDPAAAQALLDALAREFGEGLRGFGGKRVLNVTSRDAPDKADALEALLQASACDSAVYFGDDLNDEPVFERAPPQWLTVRVGRDDRHSSARFFLDSVAEVGLALQRIVDRLTATSG